METELEKYTQRKIPHENRNRRDLKNNFDVYYFCRNSPVTL